MNSFQELEFFAKQIAAVCAQASAAILSYYGDVAKMQIHTKSNHTPVTAADIAAHNILCKALPDILPLPVLGEEDGSHLTNSNDYWLIDPLDGTREFVKLSGEFCVLVARIQNRRPIFSLIYEPLTDKYWFAAKNLGAYKCENGEISRIFCRERRGIPTIITAHARISCRHDKYFKSLFGGYKHMYRGSALKFTVIAEGRADVYPKLSSTTCEWDTAAGDLLLAEAGGGMRYFPCDLYLYGKNLFQLNPPFIAFGKCGNAEIARYLSFMRNQLGQEGRFAPYFLPR